MLNQLVSSSRIWAYIAVALCFIGIAVGIVGVFGLDPVGDDVTTYVAGDYVEVTDVITPPTGCTTMTTVSASQFPWIDEYELELDGVFYAGYEIANLDHCDDLIEVFGKRVRFDGGESVSRQEFRPSIDGSDYLPEYGFDRHWVKDLGRRLLALLAGLFVGVVAALPWIAIFQVTRRLEEIRDRR